MAKFLLTVVAVMAFLATVTGLFLAALAVNLAWLFWVVIGASVLIALGRKVGPTVVKAVRQWRNYPSLAQTVNKLEARVVTLKESRNEARAEARSSFESGVEEGRAQAIGALLARSVPVPAIAAIAEFEGEVSLVAAVAPPDLPIGARFTVVVSTTGARRGVVQVAGLDPTRGVYFLICVEPTTPAFWAALRDRVDVDSSPPQGVELERFKLPPYPHAKAIPEPEESTPPEVQE